jgi:glycosyltransferase involved in cell wall biosynthesis
MKIFQVVPYYPPHVGGMEFYVEYLSKKLVEKGHEVKVFTSSSKSYSYREVMEGVEVCRIKVSGKFYNVPIANSLTTSLLNEEKPDIINTHQYPVYFSDVSALVSSLRSIPLFLHVHVVPDPKSVFSGFVLKSYYRFFERFTFHSSRCIIAPSQAYRMLLIRMGVNPEKIRVAPYGVDLSRFNPAQNSENFKKYFNLEGSKVILTVGRLNYQKGFHHLLKAMPKILLQVPNAKLVIVGEGELMTNLRNLSNSLGIANRVIFTGALSQSSVNEAYASADVFVLPSLFESLGISMLEAQAMGKPVIGTRVGGLPETLIENKSGILVEAEKPNELAKATIRLLLDQDLAKSMGQYGRKFIERSYDLEKSIDTILSLYEEDQSAEI